MDIHLLLVLVGKIKHRENRFLMHKENIHLQKSYHFDEIEQYALEKVCNISPSIFWIYFESQLSYKILRISCFTQIKNY